MGREAQKTKRIGRAPTDSEESECEQLNGGTEDGQEKVRKGVSPMRKENKRKKSRRHREKKEKCSRLKKKLKNTELFSVSELKTYPHSPSFFFFYLFTNPVI